MSFNNMRSKIDLAAFNGLVDYYISEFSQNGVDFNGIKNATGTNELSISDLPIQEQKRLIIAGLLHDINEILKKNEGVPFDAINTCLNSCLKKFSNILKQHRDFWGRNFSRFFGHEARGYSLVKALKLACERQLLQVIPFCHDKFRWDSSFMNVERVNDKSLFATAYIRIKGINSSILAHCNQGGRAGPVFYYSPDLDKLEKAKNKILQKFVSISGDDAWQGNLFSNNPNKAEALIIIPLLDYYHDTFYYLLNRTQVDAGILRDKFCVWNIIIAQLISASDLDAMKKIIEDNLCRYRETLSQNRYPIHGGRTKSIQLLEDAVSEISRISEEANGLCEPVPV